ncbi:acyltransferase family protein [Microbacterium sp.]|uniref:acyltransferase family protein n=1 Tax=Microbacterium sp. TaxID=51671 RepID=UPI003242F754
MAVSTTVVRAQPATRAEARRQRQASFRPDIQALRAIAIVAVVLNHVWPERLSGGYIGVDIFFVISGFLITSHLERELTSDGRVRLGRFYARRVRRLLPAAGLVLLVTAVGVFLFLPYTRWEDNAAQIIASGAYIENWVLAALSVNYSAHNAAASAVQHYWSLSVEEQFYVLWPLAMMAAVLVGRRFAPRTSVRARLWGAVLPIVVLSFIACLVYTLIAPSQAYFVTFTRAWQFAMGGAIALLVGRTRRVPRLPAAVFAAIGVGALVSAAVLFGPQTPYPGVAALLPVAATSLIILAGSGHERPLPVVGFLAGLRPVQWLGDVSYSLYLWHWPLLVILPLALKQPRGIVVNIAILVAATLLAWMTRRAVEVPCQRLRWWAKSTRRALSGMAAIMAVVAIIGGSLFAAGLARTTQADADVSGLAVAPITEGCTGPVALLNPTAGCDPQQPVTDPVVPPQAAYWSLAPECADLDMRFAADDRRTTRQCDFRAGTDGPRVWLIGDSHAEQWQGAIFVLARERHWDLTISSFSGCPPLDVAFRGFRAGWGMPDNQRCIDWAAAVAQGVVDARPDLVLTSMTTRQERVDDGSGRSEFDQYIDGATRTWSRFLAAGIDVVPILDVPYNVDVRPPDCLLTSAETPRACARPRSAALPPDALAAAAGRVGLGAIDLTAAFCDSSECFAAVGGVPVYVDNDHISATYSRALAPWFARSLDAIVGGAAGGP